MEEQTNSIKKAVLVIIAIVIIIVIFVVIQKSVKKTNPLTVIPTSSPISNPSPAKNIINSGSFNLKIADGAVKKESGKEFTVDVLADSNGKDVVGYDIILQFDSTRLDFIKSESKINDFTIYKNNDTGKISFTGVKKIASNSTNILSGKSLVTLTFKAKAQGHASISIIKERQKEVTQFIDGQTQIYYPKVNSINLEIL